MALEALRMEGPRAAQAVVVQDREQEGEGGPGADAKSGLIFLSLLQSLLPAKRVFPGCLSAFCTLCSK